MSKPRLPLTYKPPCNVLEKNRMGREASIKIETITELHLELTHCIRNGSLNLSFPFTQGYLCNPPKLSMSNIGASRSQNIFNAADGIIVL